MDTIFLCSKTWSSSYCWILKCIRGWYWRYWPWYSKCSNGRTPLFYAIKHHHL